MRVHKYRAWDKARKKMIYEISDMFDGYPHWENGEFRLTDCVEQGTHTEYRELELLEFINRLDKNKKEIYEGDIVKYKDDGVITTGVIKYVEEEAMFMAFDNDDWGSWVGGQNIEIIGNIRETPELMEEK